MNKKTSNSKNNNNINTVILILLITLCLLFIIYNYAAAKDENTTKDTVKNTNQKNEKLEDTIHDEEDTSKYMEDYRTSQCSNFNCKYIKFNDDVAKKYQICKTNSSGNQECCVSDNRKLTQIDKEMGITQSSINDLPGCPIYCKEKFC